MNSLESTAWAVEIPQGTLDESKPPDHRQEGESGDHDHE